MLRERIAARLEALGINQFEAVEGTSLSRHFVYDILAGRKDTVRTKNLTELARALKCSVDYLSGISSEVGIAPTKEPVIDTKQMIPPAGIIDAQSWRLESPDPVNALNLVPLPQYAASRQGVYLFRGEPFENIRDGMLVVAVVAEDYARNHGIIGPGTPVIIERRRQLDGETLTQTTIRKLSTSAADRAMAKRIEQDKGGVDAKGGGDEGRIVAVPVLAMLPI